MNDLADLQPTSIGVQTSIGELQLHAQRFQDIGPFSKLSADDSPSRRLRSYLPNIASKVTSADVHGARVPLDEASCLQLSDDDMERIAEAYLSLAAVRRIADDQKARSNPMERAGAEPSTAYLDRLLRVEHDRQMEDPATTYAAFSGRFGAPLSTALHDVDRQASTLKEAAASFITAHDVAARVRLAEHHASVERASATDATSPVKGLHDAGAGGTDPWTADTARSTPGPDTVGPRSDREAVVELTRSIGWITAQSAHLLSGLSESATQFLRQFAATAEASEARTRRLLRVALFFVVTATLFAAGACALALFGMKQQRDQQRITAEWQQLVLATLKSNAAAQDQRAAALESALRQLAERQAAANAPAPIATDASPRPDPKDIASATRRDTTKSTPATARATKRKTTH
jgi:hypothetical protein